MHCCQQSVPDDVSVTVLYTQGNYCCALIGGSALVMRRPTQADWAFSLVLRHVLKYSLCLHGKNYDLNELSAALPCGAGVCVPP